MSDKRTVARMQYRQAHEQWQRVMYDLLLTDEQLYYRMQNAADKLLATCFDFGLQEGNTDYDRHTNPESEVV